MNLKRSVIIATLTRFHVDFCTQAAAIVLPVKKALVGLVAVTVVEPAPVALVETAVNLVVVANIRILVQDPVRRVPAAITQVAGLVDVIRVLLGNILLVAHAVATRAQPARIRQAVRRLLAVVHLQATIPSTA